MLASRCHKEEKPGRGTRGRALRMPPIPSRGSAECADSEGPLPHGSVGKHGLGGGGSVGPCAVAVAEAQDAADNDGLDSEDVRKVPVGDDDDTGGRGDDRRADFVAPGGNLDGLAGSDGVLHRGGGREGGRARQDGGLHREGVGHDVFAFGSFGEES